MSDTFQSPIGSGEQAASGYMSVAQPVINEGQSYASNASQNQRNAIAGMGENPFFAAAGKMNPQAYATNPLDTVSFDQTLPGGQRSRTTIKQPKPKQPTQPGQPAPKQG